MNAVFAVLRELKDATVAFGDLLEVFLTAGYGASYSKMDRMLAAKQNDRLRRQNETRLKQSFYATLYRLRKDGLIEQNGEGEEKTLSITKYGRARLSALLRNEKGRNFAKKYSSEIGDNFIIVVFDIPEHERKKRAWLRGALCSIGLTMLQKNVWMGKAKVPEGFIQDLFDLDILSYVEIFEITKTGTIKSMRQQGLPIDN